VKHVSSDNFGLLIAYLLPGYAALWGLQPFVPGLDGWLGALPSAAPTVGGFLHSTVAAVAAGMTVSTIRWLAIDSVHHATGLRPPAWDFSRLRESAAAFDLVVEHYYRYYQFHANTLVSLLLVFAGRRWVSETLGPGDLGLLALMAVFFAGSRNTLRRYYTRGGQLLRESRTKARPQRANGETVGL
jgi:hypothetical protein